jgi:Sad1 / UNC-like C-terminal
MYSMHLCFLPPTYILTNSRASSVQHRNMKEYGPMNALRTENGSSCWYSDGDSDSAANSIQQKSLVIDFKRTVRPHAVKIQFQAGFSAATCQLQIRQTKNQSGWERLDDLELQDVHRLQSFSLQPTDKESDAIQLILDDFTDFYGRVMIYRLEVWGKECENEKEK